MKESDAMRWLMVLLFLTILTGAMATGIVPTLATGLSRWLFYVYGLLLLVTAVTRLVRPS